MSASGSSAAGGIDRGTKMALVAMALGVFVIANDFTALSVAVPDIEADFDTTLSRAQWVINGYALVFGVLIVTGGRLADLFGRKRLFMIGATIFAVFSLLSALAVNIEMLIAARALMGVGGAIMWPAVLGMTYGLLPDDKAGLAGGLILGVAGLGNAFGPLLGGVLTDALSWRWVFFVNLPIAAFAMFVTHRKVSESTADDVSDRRMDYGGVAIISLGVVGILIGLDQGPTDGFGSPDIFLPILIGLGLVAYFFVFERRQGQRALVPNDVLQNKLFAAACATVLLMSAIFFAALLYLPQFMEKILGWSAVEAGAGLLPMMGLFALTSFTAGSLYDRLGPRFIIAAGAIALAVGMFALSFLDGGSSYLFLVPGMMILGVGVGLFYSSMTTAAVTALDPSRSSLAGGIIYMCQIAGGAVGLGINTAIVESFDDFAEGIGWAFKLDAVLAVVGLLVVLRYVGGKEEGDVHAHKRRHLRHHHRAHA